MTYGRSLKRHLDHFGLPALINGWAHLEQDRFGWHKLATEPPFAILIGKPSCGTHFTRRNGPCATWD